MWPFSRFADYEEEIKSLQKTINFLKEHIDKTEFHRENELKSRLREYDYYMDRVKELLSQMEQTR